MLKVRTMFSGIGSPESALKNIGIDYELVDFCEIDKFAIKSYCAIHGVDESKNLGDISKVWGRDLPYADLLVWGFPCQDISVAGNLSGIKEGETRSGLYYEGFRILKETKPKYSVIENVKNLVGKRFKNDFKQMLEDIESLGYNNYWQVLNAKNYGIPQNRERVFIVSIREDVDDGTFEFPIGFDNGLRLKDFLEDEVDEKFYISEEKTAKLISQLKSKPNTSIGVNVSNQATVLNKETDIASTLLARDYKGFGNQSMTGVCVPSVIVKQATKKGYDIATVGDSIDLEQMGSKTRRGRVGKGVVNTLNTSDHKATLTQDCRIRKLTPRECWKLMGFSDDEFQKAKDAGVSNSQLYRQSGNSIVTNVLAEIFIKLLGGYINE